MEKDDGNGSYVIEGVMDLLGMGLAENDIVTITIKGPTEKESIVKIKELLETNFDFER